MIIAVLWLILIMEIVLIFLWGITRQLRIQPKAYGLQRDVDLRLTYKRYVEIYPSTRITYPEYKRMQRERAYKRAICSTKIKRMVR